MAVAELDQMPDVAPRSEPQPVGGLRLVNETVARSLQFLDDIVAVFFLRSGRVLPVPAFQRLAQTGVKIDIAGPPHASLDDRRLN